MLNDEELAALVQRMGILERTLEELRESDAETKRRYGALKTMMTDVTQNASAASIRADLASQKALIASSQASLAAKAAAELGALEIAEAALAAARAAADAAGDAAAAAAEAWKSALVAAGHTAESELMQMSIQAGNASRSASAAAIQALKVFSDAFEVVKNSALKSP